MSCVVFCKLVTSRHSGQVPVPRGLFSPQGEREVFEKKLNKISPLSALRIVRWWNQCSAFICVVSSAGVGLSV